jgi:oligoribonuclease
MAGGHRALADILESIRELEYYRKAAFVAAPGPTTEQVQAVSAAVVEEFGSRL